MFARSCPTNRRGAADGAGVGPKRARCDPSRRFPGHLRERLCELTLSPDGEAQALTSALPAAMRTERATAEDGRVLIQDRKSVV